MAVYETFGASTHLYNNVSSVSGHKQHKQETKYSLDDKKFC